MLSGAFYDPKDPTLEAMRHQARARALTQQYNQTASTDAAGRLQLLTQLLGQAPQDLDIQPPFHCDHGVHIEVGAGVFMNFNCFKLDCARVSIGAQTMLGPMVQVYTATHPLDAAARCSGRELAQPIHIGRRVWLGGGGHRLSGGEHRR
jgi:maltose O-acetyltransferase